jgi:hypothetical protein
MLQSRYSQFIASDVMRETPRTTGGALLFHIDKTPHLLVLACVCLMGAGVPTLASAQSLGHQLVGPHAASTRASAERSVDPAAGSTDGADPDGPAETTGQEPATSPLNIHIGDADLLIGGFMDATMISRSVYTGNGLGTSFGNNPFQNVPQGNINETRFSTQNSRITLQAASKVGTSSSVKGYIEVDFLGNAPNGLNVTSNSNTLRMRLYWAQYTQGKFEFLGGQSWSLLTPNRQGLSPMPSDIFYTQDVDTNYQMGLTWGRTTQFRFIAHASDSVTAGLSLENPQQYVGSAVTLPAAFPTFQVDQGTMATNVPNSYPDIIGKVAFDPKTDHTHQHIDAAVLIRGFKTYDPVTNNHFTETGTAGEVSTVLEVAKNVRLVGAAYYGSGGGRYIANTNLPDFIVNGDSSISLVKSHSIMAGPEVQAGAKTLIYGYYSEVRADRTLGTDLNGKPIGFGIPGSTAANGKIIEPTVGFTETFFRDPKIGGMQLMFQYSFLERTPFAGPTATPGKASMHMVYVNVRYLLP